MPREIVILHDEYDKYGCPYCGTRNATTKTSSQGCLLRRCENPRCKQEFITMYSGIIGKTESIIGINGNFPVLQDHPRPNRQKADILLEQTFTLQIDYRFPRQTNNKKCFICGTCNNAHNNEKFFCITSKTIDQKTAQFIASELFNDDGVECEFNTITGNAQILIFACEKHLPRLIALREFVHNNGKRISGNTVREAKTAKL